MILRALVLRPLLREKARSAMTIAGIAAGVAVVVAIQLANQSALRAFSETVDAVAGKANFQIVSDAGTLDESLLLQLQPLWQHGARFAPVIDAEGLFEPSGTPVRLLAVDLLSDLHFRDYRYARIKAAPATRGGETLGDLLSLFADDAIVVPAPFAREHHLTVGSSVVLNFLGRRRTMRVSGLLEAEGPATAFNGNVIVADIATAQAAFDLEGRLSRIDLLLPDEDLVSRIVLPHGVRIERPSRRNERVEKMLRAFRINLFALAGVALLVGMFLVYNTVLISILRRRKDVGILKTLGTSPRQILAAFAAEGLVFGVAGGIIGVILGRVLAAAVLAAVGRTVNALYVSSRPESIELTAGVIAAGMAVAVLLSLLSAAQPAIEASRIRPQVMIRTGLQQRVGNQRRLTVWAIAAFIAAALTAQLPPIGGIPVAGYIAVLFVVAGFSLLAPAIVRATSRFFAPLLARVFGVIGRLAAVSLPASLRRTAIASAALATATGMMIAVALMVGSFRETVRIWVDQTVSSDLWLRPSKGLSNAGVALFPPEISEELMRVPFVAAIDRARGRDLVYQDTLISVGSGDFEVAVRYGDLPMVTPSESAIALRAAIARNGVVVSESFSLKFDRSVGDSVTFGGRSFPITGVYRDYSNDRGVVVMDRSLYVETFDDRAINTIVIYLREGMPLDEARRWLELQFGRRYGAFAVTNGEIRAEVMRIFDQTFMITYALLGIAIVVAVLGVVNTLSALILERTRELALLRVTGVSATELRTMILLESTLLGIASTASGLVMGYALSWILINVINKQSFGWTIDFHAPVGLIVLSLAVTVVSSALAGLAPASFASRIHVASAIKSE